MEPEGVSPGRLRNGRLCCGRWGVGQSDCGGDLGSTRGVVLVGRAARSEAGVALVEAKFPGIRKRKVS